MQREKRRADRVHDVDLLVIHDKPDHHPTCQPSPEKPTHRPPACPVQNGEGDTKLTGKTVYKMVKCYDTKRELGIMRWLQRRRKDEG